MIEQLLMNLCINARDAMPEGGELHISTRMLWLDEDYCRTQEWARPGPYAVLQVRDTGCGIAPEVMPQALRALLLHEALRRGHGARAGHRLRHRAPARGHDLPALTRKGRARSSRSISRPSRRSSSRKKRPRRGKPKSRPAATRPSCSPRTTRGVRKVAAIFLRRAGYTVFEAEDGRGSHRNPPGEG